MKHLLLSASLLLFAANMAAQTADLHVSPNGLTDSYIYANDVVLYVENDINLVENTTEDTQASIYLRGDAQLIQGDKATSLNSGDGSISVWQRGFANAYDYNYWASPVGVPAGAPGNTNFGISRIFDVRGDVSNNLEPTRSTPQSTIFGLNGEYSDVPAGVEGTLGVSRRWIYTMRAQSGYANWIFIGQNPNLAVGEGFTMKGTGLPADVGDAHDQLYDFRGRPNDGEITVTVAHNGTVGQETLTGNPYPSALDMAEFLTDPINNDIEAAAYYWDQNRATNSHYIEAYEGGYGTWIPNPLPAGAYTVPTFIMYDGSGNPITGSDVGFGTMVERRFAPIGQGFMVRGDASIAPPAPGTGTATFTNSMRRHVALGAVNLSEFRNNSGPSLSASSGSATLPSEPGFDFPTLRFHVEINDLYVRDMVMIFAEETTKGKDRGWDAKHPRLVNSGDAFWKLEEETHPYVIQSRPFDEYDVIPLGLRVRNGTTNFIVKLAESHNFTNNMYLYDLVNNSYQRLDSENKAMITHNGTAGKIEDRYFIVFRRGIQDDQIPLKIADLNLDFFQNNKLSQLEVFNPETIDIKTASVYDMSGKQVIHERNLGKQNTYTFSTADLSSGVYLVKLVTQDDLVVDYKVTVHNKN